jgi:hydroxymethylbilane synthase
MWQARHVADILQAAGFLTELLPVETTGDKKLDVSLSKIGDKGVFTLELEQMLLKGEAEIAVHSAKDMPSALPEGLQIIAFTKRENASDVLISHKD